MRGKRNWKKWWLGYLSHIAIGYGAARLMRKRPVEGVGLLGIATSYQALEYAKYKDTVAVDMKDLMIGYGFGLLHNILEEDNKGGE